MNKPLPNIRQSIAHLRKLLRKTTDVKQHQRLQMLYLFKSEQAHDRKDVAALLGVHRNSVSAWLKSYERGGLQALLSRQKPKGAVPALDERAVQRLRRRLWQSDGFASYREAQEWIEEQLRVKLSLAATFYWVHIKCGASPKVVRPSHIKKK